MVEPTATTFETWTYPVNPGLATAFRWLPPIAGQYEMYKFHKLAFSYENRCATDTTGSVLLAFDFDVKDPPPTSFMDAQTYRDKAGGAVWGRWTLNCDLKQGDKYPDKYVRVGTPNANYDLKTYDVGSLHICTEGAAAATIGYVYVDYIIDLYTPQHSQPLGGSERYASDITHLFKTLSISDPDGFYPYYTSGGQSMYFTQHWQGLVGLYLTGTVLSDLTAAATGPASSAIQLVYQATCDAAALHCQALWSVNAVPGTIITFTPTGTTTTLTIVSFASCAYAASDVTEQNCRKLTIQSSSSSTSTSTTTTNRRGSCVDEVPATLFDSVVEPPPKAAVQAKKR